ncbi:transferase [Sorangium cellulosum]|uniref:Citramalate synthase n=1 Tax=Sorangium cellulosum TaxID=56 RepID=A0A4P2Q177_SORCE|nr:citramalate synthase [Sorangium cellulosum]AUX22964.1 transferase [Sorangium cellulosum]
MKPPAEDAERGSGPADRVDIYDTTLRDGTQREGISLACEDKLQIARHLDAFGLTFIEGGWPGSNPKDAQFFERARDIEWKHAKIVAFGSTRRASLAPEDDPGLRALLAAGTSVCTIFGKSSTQHVTAVLRTTLDENLRMIEETIAFLRAHGRRVIYDAEHFFDGFALDRAYAAETLRAAARGGAEVLTLCDTNGGSMPWQIAAVVAEMKAALGHPLGIHAHNDSECAVANSIAAVRAGARHVQGTINGYGERCGNANLCAIIPNIELKLGMRALPDGGLRGLTELAHYVAEVANLAPDDHMAYVGRSAFAHKGGVHVAAMRREPASYQHIDPALVGNSMRTVVSELSGRGNLLSKAEEFGLEVPTGAEVEVLEQIKEREARGSSFEAAEASVALLLRRSAPGYKPPFRLLDFKVIAGQREGSGAFAEAMIKIAVGDEVVITAAEGAGPVNALDGALRKALAPVYPAVRDIQLVDYKVRILDGRDGTSATTRVLIDSRDAHRQWSTVGASTNIIDASWHALADGIEYGLTFAAREPEQYTSTLPASEVA